MNTILKGDDTTFKDVSRMRITVQTSESLANCKAEFELCGVTKEVSDISTGTFIVDFTARDTWNMPLGTHTASLRIIDSKGRFRTVDNAIRIRITDVVSEAYGDENILNYTLGSNVPWSSVTSKPSINGVVLEGNKTSRQLGIKGVVDTVLVDLTEDYTPDDLRSCINAINACLRASMYSLCFLLLAPMCLFGSVPTNAVTTARFGSIRATSNVVTSVDVSRFASVDDLNSANANTKTNEVEDIIDSRVTKDFVNGLGVNVKVESVNGSTGNVVITASSLGALAAESDPSVAIWAKTNSVQPITTETDPTIKAWAKAASKPTYTADEVGALPDTGVVETGKIIIGELYDFSGGPFGGMGGDLYIGGDDFYQQMGSTVIYFGSDTLRSFLKPDGGEILTSENFHNKISGLQDVATDSELSSALALKANAGVGDYIHKFSCAFGIVCYSSDDTISGTTNVLYNGNSITSFTKSGNSVEFYYADNTAHIVSSGSDASFYAKITRFFTTINGEDVYYNEYKAIPVYDVSVAANAQKFSGKTYSEAKADILSGVATSGNTLVLTNNSVRTSSGTSIGADNIGAVPTSRKVNGKTLTQDITIDSMTTNDVKNIVTYKRDMTNNVCVVDSFTPWDFSKLSVTVTSASLTLEETGDGTWSYFLDAEYAGGGGYSEYVNESGTKSEMENRLSVSFEGGTITRMKVAISNDTLTTYGIMTNVVAAATNAVRVAADAAYYPKASGEAWATYWDGDEVRVTITNYYGVTDIPHLYLEQRTNETGTARYKIVWDEITRWNKFLGTDWSWTEWTGAHTFKTNVLAQIADINTNKADRSWGFYDSHTGEYAPDGYTQISSPNILVAAGMGYQRTITTSGDSYWVLTANEPFVYNGTTNGAFQVKDADGNVQIEIVNGDKRTVGARCGGVSVSGRTLVANYAVVASSHPTLEVCADLANPTWYAESSASCPAAVTWSGSSGAWVASVTPTSSSATKIFVRATYQAGGETYVKHNCPIGATQLYLNGTLYNLGTATIDGHTVLTLTVAE